MRVIRKKAQTESSRRAMFAKLGGGYSGGAAGVGKKLPKKLWAKNPDTGKRVPEAGLAHRAGRIDPENRSRESYQTLKKLRSLATPFRDVSKGWNEPISDKQKGYLTSLVERSMKKMEKNDPFKFVADQISAHMDKFTKWEASQIIDIMNQSSEPYKALYRNMIQALHARYTDDKTEYDWTRFYGMSLFGNLKMREMAIHHIVNELNRRKRRETGAK